jgi:hypothetical protein
MFEAPVKMDPGLEAGMTNAGGRDDRVFDLPRFTKPTRSALVKRG